MKKNYSITIALSLISTYTLAQERTYVAPDVNIFVTPGQPFNLPGSGDYTAGYKSSTVNRYAPIGMSGKYQVTSLDTLSFQPYYLSNSNTLTVVHNTSSYCLRLTEVAQ